MLIEAVTAVYIALSPGEVPAGQAWTGLALLALVWLSTALLQVPRHRILERGFDPRAHARLVATNWIRVACWSARALLALSWLA
jgi:hypothetical protein